jgi:hypothetical protein
MFQNLSLGIEGFLGRWRNHIVFRLRKNQADSLQKHSKCASGSALTILARRENPPNGGCEQFRLGTENDRDQA